MSILELRILPPLAIARLGSSLEPLENYDLVVEDPLGHRKIRPCETLRVDPVSGEIVEAYVPREIRFRDDDRIRPVAPFLEAFARTSDDVLEPLTTDLLAAEGLGPEDVRWTITVGNIKAFRRTGDPNDKIVAVASFSDHEPHALSASARISWTTSACPSASSATSSQRRPFPKSGCATPRPPAWSTAHPPSAFPSRVLPRRTIRCSTGASSMTRARAAGKVTSTKVRRAIRTPARSMPATARKSTTRMSR